MPKYHSKYDFKNSLEASVLLGCMSKYYYDRKYNVIMLDGFVYLKFDHFAFCLDYLSRWKTLEQIKYYIKVYSQSNHNQDFKRNPDYDYEMTKILGEYYPQK